MEMTKEEIQVELENSLARIDDSFSEIKDEITKPFDDVLKIIEEKPLLAVGAAVLAGVVITGLLGQGRTNGNSSSIDRRSAQSLIEAGISNRESGMSINDSIDSAIRETPVRSVSYNSQSQSSKSGIVTTLFGSRIGKQIAQSLFKNGLNLVNSFVQDRVRKG